MCVWPKVARGRGDRFQQTKKRYIGDEPPRAKEQGPEACGEDMGYLPEEGDECLSCGHHEEFSLFARLRRRCPTQPATYVAMCEKSPRAAGG